VVSPTQWRVNVVTCHDTYEMLRHGMTCRDMSYCGMAYHDMPQHVMA